MTHRVVENRQLSGEFITKGDANNTEDPNPVAYQDVAGRAAERAVPFAGYFVTCGKHPLVIGVMGGILVLGILFDRTAEKEEERDSGKKK